MSACKPTSRQRVNTALRVTGLAMLLLLLLLETVGFPRFVTRAVTKRISESNYLVQARGMRLDLLVGLYFEDVTVYRKQVVGPPAIDCEGMRVRYNPFRALASNDYSPIVEFLGGSIAPTQAIGPDSGDGSEIKGLQVVLSDMLVEEIPFTHMSAEVSSSRSRVLVTNIVCSVGGDYGEGNASGWITFEGGGAMNGRVMTEMDPRLLLPMLERIEWKYTCELIRRFEWGEAKPLVDSRFRISGVDRDSELTCESLFSMRDYSYRGVPNETCDGLLTVKYGETNGLVSVDNITIGTTNGVIVGGFAFNADRRTVTYRTATDVNPKDFFQMVGLFKRGQMDGWSFPGVTRIVSEGVVDFDGADGDETRVLAEVESSGMGIGRLVADTCRFNVTMNASTCRFTNIHGTIWDGQFVARSDVVFSDKEDIVTFGCKLENCDFSKVLKAFTSEPNKMKGKFYVEMDGRFLMSTNALDTFKASGRMSVDDGKVFQLPIFGGLTKIMSKIIPGLDFVIAQSDVTAEFKVADGRVSSEKVSITGDVLSLQAKGFADFDGGMDFAIQLKLLSEHSVVAKVLRAVTWPITKLMEFRLKGTRKNPEWYPINFSSELLERIGVKRSGTDKKPPKAARE